MNPGAAMPRPRAAQPHGGDASVVDGDVSGDEAALDERGFDSQPHDSSAFRTTPCARASRSRAAVRVDAREERDDRDLGVAAGAPERLVDAIVRLPGGEPDDPADATAELLVRRDDVDHQVAERLPDPDHRDGRDRVQDELLGGAGLEPRRPGDELAADDDRHVVVGEPRELGARHAYDRDGQRSRTARLLERAHDVRVAPARADPDDHVSVADGELPQLSGARLRVVLGMLLGGCRASGSAGKKGDYPTGRDRERRLALDGVDEREPSRRPGSDVDDPAAGLEPGGDRVDRAHQRVVGPGDGGGHGCVGLVHERDELGRRAEVEVGVGGAAGLRHELTEAAMVANRLHCASL